MILLCQWNLNGLQRHKADLQNLLLQKYIHIFALQETHTKPDEHIDIKGFNVYSRSYTLGDRACGGVAVYVRHSIYSEPVRLFTTLQAVAVSVLIPFRITICSLYLPPGQSLDLDSLKDLLLQLPPPILLLGDVNSQNTIWGSVEDNSRGRIIQNLLDLHDLIPLNSYSPTHLCPKNGTYSSIDLSASSSSVYTRFTWETFSDLLGSDHFPILISTDSPSPSFSSTPRYNTKKANWNGFQNYLNNQSVSESLTNLDSFNLTLVEAADLYIPKTPHQYKKRPVPWWNQECSDAVRERRKALHKFNNCPSQEYFVKYKQQKAKTQWIIKKCKKKSWIEFLESINRNTPMKTIWNNINKIQNKSYRKPIAAIRHNNSIIIDQLQISNILGKHFEHIHRDQRNSPESNYYKSLIRTSQLNYNYCNLNPMNEPFSINELNYAVKRSKNTSPGADGINNEIIKNLPYPIITKLLELFNKSFDSGKYPSSWRESLIIPVLKSNKDSLFPGSYRPISLTSCVCKLFERMINRRLMWFLEKNKLLSDFQCGFRTNHSTQDHIVRLENDILNAFMKKESTLAVSFDIEKAYDTVWSGTMIYKLSEWNVGGKVLKFIKHFLTNRTFKVKVGSNISDDFTQDLGVPQGGVLSTTLFKVAMDSLRYSIPPGVEYCQYVDDLLVYSSSKNINALEEIMQNTIRLLERWSSWNGLKFSIDKTKTILFTKKKRIPIINLLLYQTKLNEEKVIKFLGVLLDSKLTWVPHIKELCKRSKKSLNLLRVLGNTKWGADRSLMLTFYRAYTRSILDYGCVAYSSAKPKVLKLLDSVHYAGLRLATGAFRSSPVNSLCAESGENPLAYRRNILISKYVLKSISLNSPCLKYINNPYTDTYSMNPTLQRPLYIRFLDITNHSFDSTHIIHYNSHNYPPWKLKNLKINLNLTKYSKKEPLSATIYINKFNAYLKEHLDSLFVYTDASKTQHGTGIAAIIGETTLLNKLPDNTTTFSAELQAILLALTNVTTRHENDIILCTDSLSSLIAIQDMFSKHPIVTQIHDTIHSLKKLITIYWLPGHEGIPQSTKVDRQAKLSTSRNQYDIKNITYEDAFMESKKLIDKQWQELWYRTRDNKLREIKATTTNWPSSNRLVRREQVVLTRLRIGHTRLTQGYLMTKEQQPICTICNTTLTIKHLLTNCLRLETFPLPTNLTELLAEGSQFIDEVFKYLRKVDLFKEI